jgi:hypothetical protein
MRTSLKSLNDHFDCTIDLSGPLVAGAAPASLPGAPSSVATLPVHVYCQLETIANRDAQPNVEGEADVARFSARSLLLVALTSIRMKDAVRVRFSPDAEHPATRIYGLVGGQRGSKDGTPMELFAPANGFLAPRA